MAEEKKNIPKLRFREFTGDNANAWEQRKLGEIVEWSKGSGLSKDALNIQGIGVPVIHYADLYKFNSVQKEVIHWTMNDIGTKIPENNLLFPMSDVTPDGLARTSTVLQSNVKAGGDVLIAKLNKDILSTFMSYQINRNKNQILPLVTGTTVRHINSKSLSTLKVTVPGKNEQKYVGSILMRFDSLIALHQRMLDEYKTLKKTMLSKIFPKNGEKYPELRFFGFTDAWELRKLGRISDISTGKAFKSSEFDKSGEFLVVTNKEISDSKFSNKVAGDRINISDDKILNKYVLIGQNILVTMDGVNIGKVGKYTNSKAVLAQRVGRVQSKQFDFVYAVLDNQKFVNKMNVLAVGNAIKHISLSQISDYHFWLPICDVEQQKIGSFFKHLDELITLHQRELELLKTLKKTMLQQMFV
ncbi:restriction endonuclease subunit S [Ligilactobacillus murinus]|nr:restriction endonuclease subunit S [Ligilactobacillus murinus]